MRSPADRLRALALCAVLAATWPPLHALTSDEVRQAAAQVAKDPNLGGTRKQKTLRLRPHEENMPRREPNGTLRWLGELVGWISEAGRLLVWLAGATLVALLTVGIHRWVLVRGDALAAPAATLPTHVQGLDIRAESLPAAIGAAAARLWQGGEHRAALSLLYRGALSRLVHRHAVPVRGSSTEGECVQLARSHTDPERGEFVARLVQVWQVAVYGARLPDPKEALDLCGTFDEMWPALEGAGK